MIAENYGVTLVGADWNPLAIIDWLSTAGRGIRHEDQLLVQLGKQFIRNGAPIRRMRVSFPTLNPAVSRYAYTWWSDSDDADKVEAPHNIDQSPDYQGSPVQAVHQTGTIYRKHLNLEPFDQLHPLLKELAREGITDYLVLPLRFTFDDRAVPWILATDRDGGFTDRDIAHFHHIALTLSPILEVLALQTTKQSLLHTYLGERTGQKVMKGQITRGNSEQLEAVIWYSDMRDSTALAESLDHTQLLQLLNCYFETVSDCVARQGGEVLRFVGDALLVVFPGSQFSTLADAGMAALRAAEDAHRRIKAHNQLLSAQGLPVIRYGIGLDVGTVIYGNVGSQDRLDFTVMGSVVNRAARIESLTKIARCALLVSEPFSELVEQRLRWKGAYPVKGMQHPLSVYCAKCEYQG